MTQTRGDETMTIEWPVETKQCPICGSTLDEEGECPFCDHED